MERKAGISLCFSGYRRSDGFMRFSPILLLLLIAQSQPSLSAPSKEPVPRREIRSILARDQGRGGPGGGPGYAGGGTNSSLHGFPLDLDELQKLGITPEDVIQHIRLLVEGNYVCVTTRTAVSSAASASSSSSAASVETLLSPSKKSLPGRQTVAPPRGWERHAVGAGAQRGSPASTVVPNESTTSQQLDSNDMTRQFIRNKNVTCNDGSKSGYYIRKSTTGSKRWLVFLEGGDFCTDRQSCQDRRQYEPQLMSSDQLPARRKGSGILSTDPVENPFIHDGNLVMISYCSSDLWSGTYKARQPGTFSFMGALIVEEVIRDLAALHGLTSASKFYLAGTSAGGTGVLLNLDRTAQLVSTLVNPIVEVRGIADSGWFLDNKQYRDAECPDHCSPSESAQRGMVLWQGLVPEACRSLCLPGEQWKCYFGYRLYKSLQTAVFIVQNLFDEAQILADNVGTPTRKDQWQYIHDLGLDMKNTLSNVSAVFAPACLSHVLITRSDWAHIIIDGVGLPDALKCWDSGKQEKNRYGDQPTDSRKHVYNEMDHRLITSETPRRRERYQSDDAAATATRRNTMNEGGKKKKNPRKAKANPHLPGAESIGRQSQHIRHEHGRSNQKQQDLHSTDLFLLDLNGTAADRRPMMTSSTRPRQRRHVASRSDLDLHRIHAVQQHARCTHHTLDQCAWPQCNFSCPRVLNPITGKEMDFVDDLLKQFGLDLSSIADAVGLDLPTLQGMDRKERIKLLMQTRSTTRHVGNQDGEHALESGVWDAYQHWLAHGGQSTTTTTAQ